jgi:hypothetical protein
LPGGQSAGIRAPAGSVLFVTGVVGVVARGAVVTGVVGVVGAGVVGVVGAGVVGVVGAGVVGVVAPVVGVVGPAGAGVPPLGVPGTGAPDALDGPGVPELPAAGVPEPLAPGAADPAVAASAGDTVVVEPSSTTTFWISTCATTAGVALAAWAPKPRMSTPPTAARQTVATPSVAAPANAAANAVRRSMSLPTSFDPEDLRRHAVRDGREGMASGEVSAMVGRATSKER